MASMNTFQSCNVTIVVSDHISYHISKDQNKKKKEKENPKQTDSCEFCTYVSNNKGKALNPEPW